MIINEKRLARALKSAGAVGFRLRVSGPNLELIGPDWAAFARLYDQTLCSGSAGAQTRGCFAP